MKLIFIILAMLSFNLQANVQLKSLNEYQWQVDDSIMDKDEVTANDGTTATFAGKVWDNGILPIEFASDVTTGEQKLFYAACAEWEKVAKIDCQARRDQERYIYVTKEKDSCNASIGMGIMPWSKKRKINLGPTCWNKGTIMHEIGHALSLLHEHQRSDRNDYIEINKENIKSGEKGNFFRFFWSKEFSDYDFNSIMHYGQYAFSKNRDKLITIKARPGYEQNQTSMGQRSRLSDGDIATVRELYGHL